MERTTVHRIGLAGAAVVTVLVVGALVLRAISGSAPAPSSAAVDRAGPAGSQAVDEAIKLAKERMLEERPDQAEKVLRDAILRRPNNADLRIKLGETLIAQDRPRDAYEQYNEAIGLSPDSAELNFAAGTLASMTGLIDRAAKHYQLAQQLDPTNPKYPLYLGQIQRKLGRFDEARASLLRTTALDPDLAVAWGALADLSLESGSLEMASHYVDKALAIAPASSNWRLIEARILRRKGEPEKAAVLLKAIAQEQATPDPMILREQALCYGLLGRKEDAAALYDRAVEIGHPDPKTLGELNYEAALWHERLGQNAQALTCATRAVELGDERAKRVVERLSAGG